MNDLSKYNIRMNARLTQQNVEMKRMQAHAVVVSLLRDEDLRKSLIEDAYTQIKLWREKELCSLDFIEEWEMLLKSPQKAADVLESMSPNSIRLRQNSPFSKYLKLK